MPVARTVDEWQELLGEHLRQARLRADLAQVDVARRAGVSSRALSNLENGRGSSVETLIRVVRALDRTDWLEALAPQVEVSPLDALSQARRGNRPRPRVRVAPRRR